MKASRNGMVQDETLPTGQVDLEEARAALQKERDERAGVCMEEVKQVLLRYSCHLEAVVVLRTGQVQSQVNLIAD